MYDRFFEPNFLPSSYLFAKEKWDPIINSSKGRKDITVKAEIPGIEAKDFDISIDGRLLNIRGEKNRSKSKERKPIIVSKDYMDISTGLFDCLRK